MLRPFSVVVLAAAGAGSIGACAHRSEKKAVCRSPGVPATNSAQGTKAFGDALANIPNSEIEVLQGVPSCHTDVDAQKALVDLKADLKGASEINVGWYEGWKRYLAPRLYEPTLLQTSGKRYVLKSVEQLEYDRIKLLMETRFSAKWVRADALTPAGQTHTRKHVGINASSVAEALIPFCFILPWLHKWWVVMPGLGSIDPPNVSLRDNRSVLSYDLKGPFANFGDNAFDEYHEQHIGEYYQHDRRLRVQVDVLERLYDAMTSAFEFLVRENVMGYSVLLKLERLGATVPFPRLAEFRNSDGYLQFFAYDKSASYSVNIGVADYAGNLWSYLLDRLPSFAKPVRDLCVRFYADQMEFAFYKGIPKDIIQEFDKNPTTLGYLFRRPPAISTSSFFPQFRLFFFPEAKDEVEWHQRRIRRAWYSY